MRYTHEEQRAYERGLELSRAEHGRPSTRLTLQAIEERCRESLTAGATFIPYMPAPVDLIEEYPTEGEQAAFYAGWLAGTGNLPSDLSAQLGNAPD